MSCQLICVEPDSTMFLIDELVVIESWLLLVTLELFLRFLLLLLLQLLPFLECFGLALDLAPARPPASAPALARSVDKCFAAYWQVLFLL